MVIGNGARIQNHDLHHSIAVSLKRDNHAIKVISRDDYAPQDNGYHVTRCVIRVLINPRDTDNQTEEFLTLQNLKSYDVNKVRSIL